MAQKTKLDPQSSDLRPFPRVQKFFNKPSKTRQSEMPSTDLKALVRRYQIAGALPPSNLQYGDVSNIPTSRLDAMIAIDNALEAFSELPLKVRQAVDHDPRKLEAWIVANPQLAAEAGLLVPKDSPAPSPQTPASSSGAGEAKDKPSALAGGEVKA